MSRKSAPTEVDGVEEAAAPKGGRRKVLVVLLALLLVGGAAWWFLLRSPADADSPKAGEVVALEPIQVNLADGHYLSIGIALQLTEGAHEVDGSRALDAVISLFSGLEMETLIRPKEREHLKKELVHELSERYHEEVMDVYLTQFVTQ